MRAPPAWRHRPDRGEHTWRAWPVAGGGGGAVAVAALRRARVVAGVVGSEKVET